MTKYTLRQYRKDRDAVKQAIAENQDALVNFQKRLDAGEDITLLSDDWNAAHDRATDLENEMTDIQRRWDRRNWSWQDHSEAKLVAMNID